ncbi:hypothetical protein Shyhy01_76400 [Streptomyces hygroscopicus subsp. hygroscopicus]|nr:hypothetical protein Shyhy01_76400 [Streptomyces hygroscopicus subsp. hygroscopicus]
MLSELSCAEGPFCAGGEPSPAVVSASGGSFRPASGRTVPRFRGARRSRMGRRNGCCPRGHDRFLARAWRDGQARGVGGPGALP